MSQLIPYNNGRGSTLSNRNMPNMAAAIGSMALKAAGKAVYNSLPSAGQAVGYIGQVLKPTRSKKLREADRILKQISNNEPISQVSFAPTSISNRIVGGSARVSRSKNNKSCRIRHRELLLDGVIGSISFTQAAKFPLNPGLPKTFPWASVQSSQWESYKIHSISFDWIPIAPTSTQGDVVMFFDYDSSNRDVATETQAMDHQGSVCDSCWRNIKISANSKELHILGPRKYVRSFALAGDIKTFDSGNFFIYTVNQINATDKIGKLFVSYDIELFTPVLEPSTPFNAITSYVKSTAGQNFTSASSANLNFDAFTGSETNPLGITQQSFTTFVLPVGNYIVKWGFVAGDSAGENFRVASSLLLNSVANGPGTLSYNGVAAGGRITVTGLNNVSVTSVSNTVSISVTMTGASGTLTVDAGTAWINFELA